MTIRNVKDDQSSEEVNSAATIHRAVDSFLNVAFMKTLILMAGIPGSGKSTWCEKYRLEHPGTYVIDTDETRKKITGSYLKFPDRMETIFDEMIKETNEIFSSSSGDCTVIEDSIFLDDYRRRYYMRNAKSAFTSIPLPISIGAFLLTKRKTFLH